MPFLTPSEQKTYLALLRARERATAHMVEADAEGLTWRETTITEHVMLGARPAARFADFSQSDEGAVGADWLWWWVDSEGRAFAMLVQAKRLKGHRPRWQIDFNYRGGDQTRNLRNAARILQVPDVYVLYLGGSGYRSSWSCGRPEHGTPEDICERLGVAYLPGMLARHTLLLHGNGAAAAEAAMALSRPLEDLATVGKVRRLRAGPASRDLQQFLKQPQEGAPLIAKSVLNLILNVRDGQFRRQEFTLQEAPPDAYLPELPVDQGHFDEMMYPYVLHGLRRQAPPYVQQILDESAAPDIPPEIREVARGVAVFRV